MCAGCCRRCCWATFKLQQRSNSHRRRFDRRRFAGRIRSRPARPLQTQLARRHNAKHREQRLRGDPLEASSRECRGPSTAAAAAAQQALINHTGRLNWFAWPTAVAARRELIVRAAAKASEGRPASAAQAERRATTRPKKKKKKSRPKAGDSGSESDRTDNCFALAARLSHLPRRIRTAIHSFARSLVHSSNHPSNTLCHSSRALRIS